MGREIRKVPANWNHPKKPDGDYKCLHQYDFDESYKEWKKELKEWYEGHRLWQEGKYKNYDDRVISKQDVLIEWANDISDYRAKYSFTENYKREEEELYRSGNPTYTDVAGEPPLAPNPDEYMPKGEWYQLFETISEGSPITPPFATKEELVEWLSKNPDFWGTQWNPEAAKDVVESGHAMSMIMANGKIYEPHEQYQIKNVTP